MSNLEKWCKAILQEDADKMSIGSVRTIQLIKQEFERLQKENEGWKQTNFNVVELVTNLQAKVDFYREATDKVREYVSANNDIGLPCQPLFDAITDYIDKLLAKIKELEKAILLLTEVVDEQQQRLNNYDL